MYNLFQILAVIESTNNVFENTLPVRTPPFTIAVSTVIVLTLEILPTEPVPPTIKLPAISKFLLETNLSPVRLNSIFALPFIIPEANVAVLATLACCDDTADKATLAMFENDAKTALFAVIDAATMLTTLFAMFAN